MHLNHKHIQLIIEAQFHSTTLFASFIQCNKPKASIKFILSEFRSRREIQNILWCQENIIPNDFVRRQCWCVVQMTSQRRSLVRCGRQSFLKVKWHILKERQESWCFEAETHYELHADQRNEWGRSRARVLRRHSFRSKTCGERAPMHLLALEREVEKKSILENEAISCTTADSKVF